MKITHFIGWTIVIGLLALTFWLFPVTRAQNSPQTKKYEPTEIQKLRLHVKYDAAQMAQQSLANAQAQFNAAVKAFNDQVADTKKENSWPDNLQLATPPNGQIDPENFEFKEPPPPPAAPPAKPAAPAAPAPPSTPNGQ